MKHGGFRARTAVRQVERRRQMKKLVSSGAVAARKLGSRTLVDAASLAAFYAGLPAVHPLRPSGPISTDRPRFARK